MNHVVMFLKKKLSVTALKIFTLRTMWLSRNLVLIPLGPPVKVRQKILFLNLFYV